MNTKSQLDRIDEMNSIESVIKKFYSHFDKTLGQNFLTSEYIAFQIAQHAQIKSNDVIVEIGSGPGILTRSILKYNPKKVVAIDIDSRSAKSLKSLKDIVDEKLEILTTDALNYDICGLSIHNKCKIKIIANLPYNISTVLLSKWLKNIKYIDSMVLMFQKEVGMRICSTTKKHGRLSIYTQALCTPKIILDVDSVFFKPSPKVDSVVVEFIPDQKSIDNNLKLIDDLNKITKQAFSMRRKKIKSSLAPINKNIEKILIDLDIDPNLRAEQLSITNFINIAKKIQ